MKSEEFKVSNEMVRVLMHGYGVSQHPSVGEKIIRE